MSAPGSLLLLTLALDLSGFSGHADCGFIKKDVEDANAQNHQHARSRIESLTGLNAEVRLGVSRCYKHRLAFISIESQPDFPSPN